MTQLEMLAYLESVQEKASIKGDKKAAADLKLLIIMVNKSDWKTKPRRPKP